MERTKVREEKDTLYHIAAICEVEKDRKRSWGWRIFHFVREGDCPVKSVIVKAYTGKPQFLSSKGAREDARKYCKKMGWKLAKEKV